MRIDDTVPIRPLLPGEAASVQRAVGSRRREFSAGRDCARCALEQLGIVNYSLRAGADRAPVWPDGIAGSITHCPGLVGAVVARIGTVQGLGLDAEVNEPLEPSLVELVCTTRERTQLAQLSRIGPGPLRGNWEKVTFSAKEAVYKCVASALGWQPDFSDVELTFHPEMRRFTIHCKAGSLPFPITTQLEGRFAVTAGYIHTGVVLRGRPNEVSS